MTREQANKIKKILRKENAVFASTAGYFDGKGELRVKVAEYMVYSNFYHAATAQVPDEQKEKETMEHSIKVLRALERNGMRPQYRKEQKEMANDLGKYDCRYLIFR